MDVVVVVVVVEVVVVVFVAKSGFVGITVVEDNTNWEGTKEDVVAGKIVCNERKASNAAELVMVLYLCAFRSKCIIRLKSKGNDLQ